MQSPKTLNAQDFLSVIEIQLTVANVVSPILEIESEEFKRARRA